MAGGAPSNACPPKDRRLFKEEVERLSKLYPIENLRRHASFFKALADPVRLKILNLLSHREMCVCELELALDITQPTLSYHLKLLEREGLVKSKRMGKRSFYSIRNHRILKLISEAESIFRKELSGRDYIDS